MQRFQQSMLAFEAERYFGNEDEVCFICGKSRRARNESGMAAH